MAPRFAAGRQESSFDKASSFVSPPDLAPYAYAQVAGLHRAVPSTALDKVFTFSRSLYHTGSDCQQKSSAVAFPKQRLLIFSQLSG